MIHIHFGVHSSAKEILRGRLRTRATGARCNAMCLLVAVYASLIMLPFSSLRLRVLNFDCSLSSISVLDMHVTATVVQNPTQIFHCLDAMSMASMFERSTTACTYKVVSIVQVEILGIIDLS